MQADAAKNVSIGGSGFQGHLSMNGDSLQFDVLDFHRGVAYETRLTDEQIASNHQQFHFLRSTQRIIEELQDNECLNISDEGVMSVPVKITWKGQEDIFVLHLRLDKKELSDSEFRVYVMEQMSRMQAKAKPKQVPKQAAIPTPKEQSQGQKRVKEAEAESQVKIKETQLRAKEAEMEAYMRNKQAEMETRMKVGEMEMRARLEIKQAEMRVEEEKMQLRMRVKEAEMQAHVEITQAQIQAHIKAKEAEMLEAQTKLQRQVSKPGQLVERVFDFTPTHNHPHSSYYQLTHGKTSIRRVHQNGWYNYTSSEAIPPAGRHSYKFVINAISSGKNIIAGVCSEESRQSEYASLYATSSVVGLYLSDRSIYSEGGQIANTARPVDVSVGSEVEVVVDMDWREVQWRLNGQNLHCFRLKEELKTANLHAYVSLYNQGDHIQLIGQ